VVEVGDDVSDLAVGDRVACAGGGYAVHAEFIRVPSDGDAGRDRVTGRSPRAADIG
jgi:NADPH:quinone reductase-like Zn-dependent oxidoreductase